MLRIKEVLKSKGISQIELSERMGITTVGLNKIINGNPTIETLIKIANAIEVDVNELIAPTKEDDIVPIYIKNESNYVC